MHASPFASIRRIAAATAAIALGAIGSIVGIADHATAATDPDLVYDSPAFSWSYLDDGTDPAAGTDSPDSWTAPDFDASAWPTGTGSFGAINGALGPLSGGYTPSVLLQQYQVGTTTNTPAFFFRTGLEIPQEYLETITSVTFDLRYDDAVSLFVNGEYIGGGSDAALQAAADRNTRHGGSNQSAPLLEKIVVPVDKFIAGVNTIAVRLHNGRPTSSDLYFEVERLSFRFADSGPTWEEQLLRSDLSNVILGVGATPGSRNLVWYTDDAHSTAPVVELIEASKLENGEFPAEGAMRFTADDISSEPARHGGSRGFEAFSNKLVFDDLAPATTYAYRIGDGDQWLGQWSFTTEAETDEWSFFFTGDPQIGAAAGNTGANPMERHWTADSWGWNDTLEVATSTYPDIRTHVSAGDQVESSSRLTDQLINTPVNGTEVEYLGYSFPEALKTLQNAPTLGNHDYYIGGRATYAQHYNIANFDASTWNNWWAQNNVLFIHLNTEFHYPAGDDYPSAFELHDEWLTKVLAEQGDKYEHHVVVMHRPLYSVGPHSLSSTTTRVRDTFVPLLEKHGIDALLTGHDHTYSRSHIVDGFHPGSYNSTTGMWEGGYGEVVDLGSGADAPDEVFLKDGQLVSVVANSASGSKYYDIQNAGHPYAAVQNQDYMRTYTVVDVDTCSLTYRTHRAEAHGDLALNSIVDEVRVNLADAAPTIEAPEAMTLTASQVADVDLLAGLDYSVCDAERFPVKIDGTVDAAVLDQPQTITYTIAAGTAWEVSAERAVTVTADPSETDEPGETDPVETGQPGETDPVETGQPGETDPVETGQPGETDPVETGQPGETPIPTGTPDATDATGGTTATGTTPGGTTGTVPGGAKPSEGGLASTGAELPMPVLAASLAALLAGALLLQRRARAHDER